jgi:Ca-activated chloride channel family protein
MLHKIAPSISFKRQSVKACLIILAVLFLILSLTEPKWGFHWEELKRKGVDIIVAIDVSKSMLAQDIKPNRLERAKRKIYDLIDILEGDRIGLVIFAGTSFLQCPLTLDYKACMIFLDSISVDLIPIGGTAIGDAINTCVKGLDASPEESKAIILITDGEDTTGDPIKAAKQAKEKGVKVFPLGIGKPEGAPVPDMEKGGFKKDSKGDLVLSRLGEDALNNIAIETGGIYVRSVTGDIDLKEIYLKNIKKMEQKELKSTRKKHWEERFQWPLGIAILFLLFEAFIRERKKIISILIFIVLFGFSPEMCMAKSLNKKIKEGEKNYNEEKYKEALDSFTEVQIEKPDESKLKYNIGNSHYMVKNYAEALKNYMDVVSTTKDDSLKEKTLYNLGNCFYRQGKLNNSIDYYKKALELDPNDSDAKHNLEFVLEELKKRKKENESMKEKQKNKENKEKDSKQENSKSQEDESKKKDEGKEQDQRNIPEDDKKENKANMKDEERENASIPSEKMTKEEAERRLMSLREEEKEFLKEQIKKSLLNRRIKTPEKDW